MCVLQSLASIVSRHLSHDPFNLKLEDLGYMFTQFLIKPNIQPLTSLDVRIQHFPIFNDIRCNKLPNISEDNLIIVEM